MTVCDDCIIGDHHSCVDIGEDWGPPECSCECAGYVECPTCWQNVILVRDDPDDPSYAHGECCTWAWVDSFDGCIRLDLSDASNGSTTEADQ